ncbi:DUF1311 domain-containing protein [Roseibium denhamense]|uniref:Uncharacterized conserved protein YecT, DUF1311 family n=1 Tax=Roseibium denhamense TaxID=76305 RepID=A0ABY1PBD5_9HYPH|nr:lysozyme inhibitor LprI family protein [Roseibium denhamense]MTI05300.1 DUF1311 domain-containing protein [Roseibium denhamense]SMP30455.1 Uncharacterized conserved protein YecT, DUF1311 family [Roseibium denhamense]
MLQRLAALTFLMGLYHGSAAAQQAIDCGYPLNNNERTYCAEEALEQAEEDLGSAYQQALVVMAQTDETLPDHLKGSENALKDAQDAWLVFRDKDCTAYAKPFRAGTQGQMTFLGCMIISTQQRAEQLLAMAEDYGG